MNFHKHGRLLNAKTRHSLRIHRAGPIKLCLLLLLTGCAYYNTFYNARNYFDEGEKAYKKEGKVTNQARIAYERCLEKCVKVLEVYPNSAYTDDALFMMGVIHSRLGEREKSRKKFEELLRYDPKGPFVERARLELARLFLESGELDKAKENLQGMETRFREEADLLLIEGYLLEGSPEKALREVENFLEHYPKSPLRKDALYLATDASRNLGNLEEAERHLRVFLKTSLNPRERLEAQELLGDLLFERGALEEAQEVYGSLDHSPNTPDARRVIIKKARILEALQDLEGARAEYSKLIQVAQFGAAGIEARYRLALLLEKQDSLEAALKLYEEVARIHSSSEFKTKAVLRTKALKELTEIGGEEKAESRIRLAELYLLELEKPEEALELYESIEQEFPETPLLPKVFYALVHMRLDVLPDRAEAVKYYRLLMDRFSHTLYAEEARKYFAHRLDEG